jgi:hypothetical protein
VERELALLAQRLPHDEARTVSVPSHAMSLSIPSLIDNPLPGGPAPQQSGTASSIHLTRARVRGPRGSASRDPAGSSYPPTPSCPIRGFPQVNGRQPVPIVIGHGYATIFLCGIHDSRYLVKRAI